MSNTFLHKAYLGILLVVLMAVWLITLLLLAELILKLHDLLVFLLEIARLG